VAVFETYHPWFFIVQLHLAFGEIKPFFNYLGATFGTILCIEVSSKTLNMWFFSLTHLRFSLPVAAFLWMAFLPASAVTLTESPKAEPAATSATITWSTDVASGTKVSFGTSADALTQKAEGSLASQHTVTLSGLQPRTTYYYVVGSARAKLGTGSFTTTGSSGSAAAAKVAPAAGTKTPPTTRAPPPALTAPPTKTTWASLDSLPDHFARHGGDFKAKSSDDYAAQAWMFLQRARQEALPMKWDDTGATLRVWDPARRIFAAYTRSGKTRTFFKPGNPEYWNKQPGRPVRPGDLSF